MENSMAIWMLISALFPVFLVGTLVKAFLHYRRAREGTEPIPQESVARPGLQSQDWIPSP